VPMHFIGTYDLLVLNPVMLVVKFVVGLGKSVLHFMYTGCLQG